MAPRESRKRKATESDYESLPVGEPPSQRVEPIRKKAKNNFEEDGASTQTETRVEDTPEAQRIQTVTTTNADNTARTSKPVNPCLEGLPTEILAKIFSQLTPMDLVHLSWISKDFRSILRCKQSNPIWKESRLLVTDIPGLPECPDDLSELQYANLMFKTHCNFCLEESTEDRPKQITTSFIGRIGSCTDCLLNTIRFGVNGRHNKASWWSGPYPSRLRGHLPTVRLRVAPKKRAKTFWYLAAHEKRRAEYEKAEDKSENFPIVECVICSTNSGWQHAMRWSWIPRHKAHKHSGFCWDHCPVIVKRILEEREQAARLAIAVPRCSDMSSFNPEKDGPMMCTHCKKLGVKNSLRVHVKDMHNVDNPSDEDMVVRLDAEGPQDYRLKQFHALISSRIALSDAISIALREGGVVTS